MKTLNFLTTGAAAAMLLLGSCTKDADNPQGGGGEGGVVEGIPTYATVSLSQRTGAGTYVGPEDDYVNGTSQATEVEKKITDAVVLVFNSDDVLENYVKFEDAELAAAPYAKIFATTTGKKRLYALANLGDYSKIEAIFNGQTAANKKLSNVCKVIQRIADISGATTDNKFWMSNVYKLGATIEDQVTVQKGDENTNNFTIYIGRMVAKVTPTFAADLVVNSGDGTIKTDNAEYRVRNNPNRFFSFPVYNAAGLLTSPYYDRNYTEGGSYDADGLGAGDYFDNGHDADDADGIAHTFVAAGTDSYLTENSPKEAKRHKVTFLSIKAKWEPNKNATFLAADGTKMEAAAGMEAIKTPNQGTFYRVQKWKSGKIEGYCPGIYTAQPTAFHKETIDDATDGVQAELVSREVAKADQTADTKYVVATYTNGMAYWAYWMRSRLDGTIAEKYALKRNNHFKVNIISVDGVGDPNEDDILDKDEDLEADASMKATIEVLNWNVVDIEGGI